jgi:hypothetical protein
VLNVRDKLQRLSVPFLLGEYLDRYTRNLPITDAEINTLKDENGEIRYEKVFEWALPRFGEDEQSLSEFQAARMRNYMRKRIVEDGWTPKYYTGDRVITADHVTRFYGACLAN